MRRLQSAIVIVALMAIPLALVARTGPCAQSQCSRTCAMVLHSVRDAQHQRCTCGMNAGSAQCATQSSKQVPDYGLNAPIAPTMPAVRVAIAGPRFSRRDVPREFEVAASGFHFELLQPPRA